MCIQNTRDCFDFAYSGCKEEDEHLRHHIQGLFGIATKNKIASQNLKNLKAAGYCGSSFINHASKSRSNINLELIIIQCKTLSALFLFPTVLDGKNLSSDEMNLMMDVYIA